MKDSCKGGGSGCCGSKDGHQCAWKKLELEEFVALSSTQQTYCPSKNDLIETYGNPNLFDGGWTLHGGGGVATKASFNLINGWVEYDVDFSQTHTGVNGNIYTISPWTGASGYTPNNYCDGAATGAKWCAEVDWIETNGNCGAATTLHTVEGHSGGCNADGCASSYFYNGQNKFHMRISYDGDAHWTTVQNG